MDPTPALGSELTVQNITRPRPSRSRTFSPFTVTFRRLAGLNPFKTSYFTLYDSLDTFPDRAIAWSGVFFSIAAGIPLPLIGLIFGRIVNNFPPSESDLHLRISQLLGVAVAYFLVTALYASAFGITSEKVSARLRTRLLKSLLHLDQAYLDTHDIDVSSLITEKIDIIQAGTSEKVGIFIQSMSYFIAAFTVGFILDVRLTGILLASVVPTVGVVFFVLAPMISKMSRATAEKNSQANNIAENALRAVKVVQAFDMMGALCAQHLDRIEESSRLGVKKAIFSALQTGSIFFIAYSANALAFFLGSRQAEGGNAGTVYAVVFLIIDASFVVGAFAPFLEIFARAATTRSQLQDIFDAEAASIMARANPGELKRPDLHGEEVRLQGVKFAYPAREKVQALDDINLTFKAGGFTALVGTSGGGKSTLVSLLLGTYDFHGSIKIGESDIRSIDPAHRRSQIAVLEQECILFSGTIRDNLLYGLIGVELTEDEKDARCAEALRLAAVDFIHLLPKGIHTRISNELQLSGGQKQRICLARALIKRPAILMLDEPTSALDARSEVLVMEAVRNAAREGTTVIMVAHRLSTVMEVDEVVVMGEGRVVEAGTPGELAEREDSLFSKLLEAQNMNYSSSSSSNETTPTGSREELVKGEGEKIGDGEEEEEGASEAGEGDEESQAAAMKAKKKKTKGKSVWSLLKRVASLIKSDMLIVLLGILGSIAAGGILLGESVVFGSLIEVLNTATSTTDHNTADFYCLMFFILGLIALAAYITSGSAFGVTSTRLTGKIRAETLHRLLHLDMMWFSQPEHSIHDLMSAFTKDPGDLSSLSGIALGTIFTVFTSVFGGIILALVIAWKIAIVLLAAVPIMILAGFLRLRTLTLSEIRHREAYRSANTLAAEACRSRRTVSSLGLEQHILAEYTATLQAPLKRLRHFTFISSTLLAFCLAISYFVYALAYWWGSQQVRGGEYTERQFFITLPALLFSAQAAGQLFSLSPEIARAKTAARSIFTLLDARPSILRLDETSEKAVTDSTASTTTDSSEKEQHPTTPKLRFDSVSLAYSKDSRKLALRDINISITSGQTVAFVGPSGGGKSSTLSLIERFFDPTSGSIYLDGINLRDLNIRDIRRTIGLVSQEPDLFPGSILYNVQLGSASGIIPTLAEVEAACKKCGLHEFITSLPDGYATDCGSAGTSKLSGGQKQRLAIARALIRDPEILLLDEPTSALDAHSERKVQEALKAAEEGRTTIIVAHRLASVIHADVIVVFDEGKVVAKGTHRELVSQGGLYAGMAKAQGLA